jgi:hypothetical protein
MNRRQHQASGCGDWGMFRLESAASHIGWPAGVQGWCTQATGGRDFMAASLVAKDNTSPKA